MTVGVAKKEIRFQLDGKEVGTVAGSSIWEAAKEAGVDIPALCHSSDFRAVGVCRMCVVEVEGARTAVPSCMRAVEEGMVVRSHSDDLSRYRNVLTKLMMREHPAPCARSDCSLEALVEDAPTQGAQKYQLS